MLLLQLTCQNTFALLKFWVIVLQLAYLSLQFSLCDQSLLHLRMLSSRLFVNYLSLFFDLQTLFTHLPFLFLWLHNLGFQMLNQCLESSLFIVLFRNELVFLIDKLLLQGVVECGISVLSRFKRALIIGRSVSSFGRWNITWSFVLLACCDATATLMIFLFGLYLVRQVINWIAIMLVQTFWVYIHRFRCWTFGWEMFKFFSSIYPKSIIGNHAISWPSPSKTHIICLNG